MFQDFKFLIEKSSHDSVFDGFMAEGTSVSSADGSGFLGEVSELSIAGSANTVQGNLSISAYSDGVSFACVLDAQFAS